MIEILRVVEAYGICGALRVFLFSNNLNSYRQIYKKNGEGFSFDVVRLEGAHYAIISIEGISGRNSAELLRHTCFYIKKSDLIQLKQNEFYIYDLIGKEAEITGSNEKCKIIGVQNFGAGDLIEMSYEEGSFFIPFTIENFPDFDDKILITLEAFNGFKN